MELEVVMEKRRFTREFKLEAMRLIKDRGVSYGQASGTWAYVTSQLRDWVKKFADDPQHACLGHGQMKPEQLEVAARARSGQAEGGARHAKALVDRFPPAGIETGCECIIAAAGSGRWLFGHKKGPWAVADLRREW
jgi:transposase